MFRGLWTCFSSSLPLGGCGASMRASATSDSSSRGICVPSISSGLSDQDLVSNDISLGLMVFGFWILNPGVELSAFVMDKVRGFVLEVWGEGFLG